MIFAYNHPSGELRPSNSDLKIHKQLAEAGKILGIRVLDHIIPGGCAAWNRGADYVEHLAPALRAGTRYSTGHREPHNQTAFACAAHGAGQHRDYFKDTIL